MSDESEDTEPEMLTISRADFNAQMKQARLAGEKRLASREARAQQPPAPAAQAPLDYNALGAAIAAAMQQGAQPAAPQAPRPPDVAAPRAPSTPNKANAPHYHGMSDLFSMDLETISGMSPRTAREIFENTLKIAREAQGYAPRPQVPGRGGRR